MEIVATVIGVILGFALSELNWFIGRRNRAVTNFKAIKSEIEFCSQMAQVFIKDKIGAPLYRLPTEAYQSSLPQLLADSSINEHELRAIQKFYMQVVSLNRGLDQAESARGNEDRLRKEFSRNYSKAEKLLPTDSYDSYFTEAYNLLQQRCNSVSCLNISGLTCRSRGMFRQ